MSGAFNIDIEVGKADQKDHLKIYCASLTETWECVHSVEEVLEFHKALQEDPEIRRNKIGLGDGPAMNKEDKKDFSMVQLFFSRMGCTSAVLRVKLFHDFLAIPPEVREGLSYAQHKGFGKTLREGYMTRLPRFTRKGLGKRFLRLTRDDRGGSLISYKTEEKKTILASFKLGASTEIHALSKVENAFKLTSGKRQWTIQASKPADYNLWKERLNAMLKPFGNAVTGDDDDKREKIAELEAVKRGSQYKELQTKNGELKQELDLLYGQVEGMTQQLERLKAVNADLSGGNNAMKAKVQCEFENEKDALVRDYKLQLNNLEDEIYALSLKINAKTAMDSGGGAMKKLLKGISFGLSSIVPEELKSEVDTEKKILDTFTEDERATIKFMHRHLHRHAHIHNHRHRHLHLHKEAEDNIDDFDNMDLSMENSHKISHTITHSNTQFQITGRHSFF